MPKFLNKILGKIGIGVGKRNLTFSRATAEISESREVGTVTIRDMGPSSEAMSGTGTANQKTRRSESIGGSNLERISGLSPVSPVYQTGLHCQMLIVP